MDSIIYHLHALSDIVKILILESCDIIVAKSIIVKLDYKKYRSILLNNTIHIFRIFFTRIKL